MTIWIGTSGFQYPEWKGKFYPEDLSKAKMLTYYASVFNSTEVNYTFKNIPSEKTIARWSAETPDTFRFALKAPQRVTHYAKLRECSELMVVFSAAVQGLGGKLGPVLFQLPPTFKVDTTLLREFLASLPPGLRAAFEFRHESWLSDEVFSILAEGGAALCLAESEEFQTPKVATASFGYLRLRREGYTPSQIKKWAEYIREQRENWSDCHIYFKHEETCAGPPFARKLMEHL